jgi:hypothetical protein
LDYWRFYLLPTVTLGVECAFKTSYRQDKDSHYKEIEGWIRSALSSSSMTSKMLSMGETLNLQHGSATLGFFTPRICSHSEQIVPRIHHQCALPPQRRV